MSNDDLNRRAAEALGWTMNPAGQGWVHRHWRSATGCYLMAIEAWHPCESRDQAAMLEAEIWKLERQARWDYRNALYREWVSSEDSENFDLWLITAPAEARVKACLAVLEQEGKSDGD